MSDFVRNLRARVVAVVNCGILAVLLAIGCNGQSEVAPRVVQSTQSRQTAGESELAPAAAAPSVASITDGEMVEGLAAGQLPLRFPASGDDQATVADDVADAPESGGGLLGVLRQTVDLSPIFEETGIQDGLADGLIAAEDELSRQKHENRRALREANRQVRVGAARQSPNLILISAEGLGYGDLSCYGQSGYATAHVDRLAERGLRFTDFYAGSALPRASRWCLMTALNTGRATAGESGQEPFSLAGVGGNNTLPDVLWNSGYTTGLVGVWDERIAPINYGYDEWSGFPAGEGVFDSFPSVVYLDATRARLPGNTDGRRGVHAGNLLLQESLSFLDRHSQEDRPCFLHVSLPAFDQTSNQNGMDMPTNVAELDKLVGGMLDWLDERELAERTCIMLMGVSAPGRELASEIDQFARTGGLQVHESGLCEGNLRVPLIVCWDGRIAAGALSQHVCAVWDVLPSLADLASAMRRPQRLDGLSFTGSLLGGTQSTDRLLYWETREHGFGQAVRKGVWKGVRLPRETDLSLFDLSVDPSEQQDLSATRPEVVEQLVVR